MNDGQSRAICPQCGRTDAVHSIGELATLARNQLGQPSGYGPTPPGGLNQPPSGYGQPAAASQPTPAGFNPPPPGGWPPPPPPGYTGPPPPGYSGSAQPGQPRQSTPLNSSGSSGLPSLGRLGRDLLGLGGGAGGAGGAGGVDSVEDGVADVVMGAAARFVGRKISQRVQQAVNERVVPAMAARKDAVLQQQIAIAERHPDLRACLTDQVVFLTGGQRVLPLPSLAGGFTVEQSDALVARLRGG